ncbi:MAG: sterol desaturase family protein [Novosphingobium sp.]
MVLWIVSHPIGAVFARSFLWLVLATLVFVPLELMFPLRQKRPIGAESATNLAWYGVNSIFTLSLIAVPAALIASVTAMVIPPAISTTVDALPLGIRMVLAMIVGEIGFYWGHRWSHEWRWLWRFHAIHHSAQDMTYLVNTRMHPVDMLFTRLCGVTLLLATGLSSPTGSDSGLIIGGVLFAGSLWSYFIHSNISWRLSWFENILTTPAFHHWHHTRTDHANHNYASMLPLMDRLFGSYYLPKQWPEEYGTDTFVADNIFHQLTSPFWPERVKAVTVSKMDDSADRRPTLDD